MRSPAGRSHAWRRGCQMSNDFFGPSGWKIYFILFCLIFAIFLSLKITVIFRNVGCSCQVVRSQRTENEALEKDVDATPTESGRMRKPQMGEHLCDYGQGTRSELFSSGCLPTSRSCFLFSLCQDFQKLTGQRAGWEEAASPSAEPPAVRTISVGLSWADVDAGPEPVRKLFGWITISTEHRV